MTARAFPGTEPLLHEFVNAAGDTLVAVLFYGSHLHHADATSESAIDFIAVVANYRAFYQRMHSVGRLHRPVWLLAALAHVLPPNSFAFQGHDVPGLAKCQIITRRDLEHALGQRPKDHLLAARLVQRVLVVWSRDRVAAEWVEAQLKRARSRVLEWTGPFLDTPFNAGSVARRMLELSYAAELRPEPNRAAQIFEQQRDYLESYVSRVLQAAAASGQLQPTMHGYQFVERPSVWRRRALRWYFVRSNARVTARWLKHMITFDGWLPYLVHKVERRSGVLVKLSRLEKKLPLVFLWPRAIRVLRAVSRTRAAPHSAAPPKPHTCGLRETVSFLRDPAAFTAGRGLAFGDFYRVRVPGSDIQVVTDPALAELILVQHAASFEKSRIYWRELRRSLGDCLGALDGESWEYLRRAQRPFFAPRAIQELLPAVSALTDQELRELANSIGDGAKIPLLDVLSELNARIVLGVLFGQMEELDAREITRRITEGHAIIAWKSRFPWRPPLARLTWRHRTGEDHKRYLGAYADRLRHSPSAADARTLLHALIRLPFDPDAPRLPAELLRNELTFHLGASTETQAAAESWTLYLLWKHPDTLQRVRAEIACVAGDTAISPTHLSELRYTRRVVQESLRLYPPVLAIVRDCVRSVELPTCMARPGQSFLVSVLGMHRNPRLWADASAFAPDRFAADTRVGIERFQYMPFGAGRHLCIGQHLAMATMVLTVAQFARRFNWSFADREVRPVAEPSLKPSQPFMPTLRARR